MKLHWPNVAERFLCIIDDNDADEIEFLYFETYDQAVAHVKEQYGDIPDTTEPDGENYADGERPNCVVQICEVLARTTL